MKKLPWIILFGFALMLPFCIDVHEVQRHVVYDTIAHVTGEHDTFFWVVNNYNETVDYWSVHPHLILTKEDFERCEELADSLLLLGYRVGCINDSI